MSNETQVRLEQTGHRATITFFTEAGINVLSLSTINALGKLLDQLAERDDVWSVVVRAEGKAFLAGANIKEMAPFDPAMAADLSRRGNAVMNKLANLDAITVAAIHGAALGGGCEVTLACDFRVAVADAKIGVPEVTLGLIPGWGGTKRLPKLIGLPAAKRLLFSGEALKAADAKAIGLVDRVVETADGLDGAVSEWISQFTRGGPRAIAKVKQSLRTGDEPAAFAECFDGPESREGMGAFVEKRAAKWTEESR